MSEGACPCRAYPCRAYLAHSVLALKLIMLTMAVFADLCVGCGDASEEIAVN